MMEHKKVYSNGLYIDAINGKLNMLKQLTEKDIVIIIDKFDDDMYKLKLKVNDTTLFSIVNTIDCLYCIIDGYTKALYDKINYSIF